MTEPFIGEIAIVGFNFAPKGWATCDGQLIPIQQNTALYSLLGVRFGGNGTSNFALPDLRGRAPMGFGNGAGLTPRAVGESGGSETVTLLSAEVPPHTHSLRAGNAKADRANASGAMLAASADDSFGTGALVTLAPTSVSVAGGSQPHNNMQPFLVLNFVIALQGVFPVRS
ncbi:MAG: phage tail protein [Rhodanobacteraceae bacterium]|jgi:microcystin-dependent protein|nr:phage tail protein [Rhodanobacteraceae bacterium]